MTGRKLVAALACRNTGTRLYGKPMQNLKPNYSIIDHILTCIAATPEIDETVLGISEGIDNLPFVEIAKKHGVGYIIGDEKDVLWRLIQCGRAAAATDIFRITTECPFTAWEMLPEAWANHVSNGNDITIADYLPVGALFELYTMESLERSHRDGNDGHRSEYCSNYAREHPDRFQIEVLKAAPEYDRTELRITVDYPEDLVVCRRLFDALESEGPRIPMKRIVDVFDAHPDMMELLAEHGHTGPLWDLPDPQAP